VIWKLIQGEKCNIVIIAKYRVVKYGVFKSDEG
jgi:hypothetical protein